VGLDGPVLDQEAASDAKVIALPEKRPSLSYAALHVLIAHVLTSFPARVAPST
jgi:hypothetical protein